MDWVTLALLFFVFHLAVSHRPPPASPPRRRDSVLAVRAPPNFFGESLDRCVPFLSSLGLVWSFGIPADSCPANVILLFLPLFKASFFSFFLRTLFQLNLPFIIPSFSLHVEIGSIPQFSFVRRWFPLCSFSVFFFFALLFLIQFQPERPRICLFSVLKVGPLPRPIPPWGGAWAGTRTYSPPSHLSPFPCSPGQVPPPSKQRGNLGGQYPP